MATPFSSFTLTYPDQIVLSISASTLVLQVNGVQQGQFDTSSTICTSFQAPSGISYTLQGLQLFNNAFAPQGVNVASCSQAATDPNALLYYWQPVVPISTSCSFLQAPSLEAREDPLAYIVSAISASMVVGFLYLVFSRSQKRSVQFLQKGIGISPKGAIPTSRRSQKIQPKGKFGLPLKLILIVLIIIAVVVTAFVRQRYLPTFQVLGPVNGWAPAIGSAYPLLAPFLGYVNTITPTAITSWMAQASFPQPGDAKFIQTVIEFSGFTPVEAYQCLTCSNVAPACEANTTNCPSSPSACGTCSASNVTTQTSTVQSVVDFVFQYGIPALVAGSIVFGGA